MGIPNTILYVAFYRTDHSLTSSQFQRNTASQYSIQSAMFCVTFYCYISEGHDQILIQIPPKQLIILRPNLFCWDYPFLSFSISPESNTAVIIAITIWTAIFATCAVGGDIRKHIGIWTLCIWELSLVVCKMFWSQMVSKPNWHLALSSTYRYRIQLQSVLKSYKKYGVNYTHVWTYDLL